MNTCKWAEYAETRQVRDRERRIVGPARPSGVISRFNERPRKASVECQRTAEKFIWKKQQEKNRDNFKKQKREESLSSSLEHL